MAPTAKAKKTTKKATGRRAVAPKKNPGVRALLKELEALGTAQNRKVYARHGVTGKAFGVSYANQGKLVKRLGVDHDLALALWDSGNHDAQVLAAKIADPAAATAKQLDAWKKDLYNYVQSDAFAGYVAKTRFAAAKMEVWRKARNEWVASVGWQLISHHAQFVEDLPDRVFADYLKVIEAEIQGAKNRVRHAMNGALIGIGLRSAGLEKKAVAVARRIGVVEVDHGETGCKTPDAAGYIAKTKAHRAKRGR